MKILAYCKSINGPRTEEVVDLLDWGMTDEKWKKMSIKDKNKVIENWASDKIQFGYIELQGEK